jgi:hypothetical protein
LPSEHYTVFVLFCQFFFPFPFFFFFFAHSFQTRIGGDAFIPPTSLGPWVAVVAGLGLGQITREPTQSSHKPTRSAAAVLLILMWEG